MKRSPAKASAAAARPDAAATAVPPAAARKGGRPSRTEAELLGERILDVATALFFTAGYGATTIEAVAKRARISKRTFYHRFDDKASLLRAVVDRTIDRMRPPARVPLLEGASLQEVLERLAALILQAALSPPAIALHRLIVAESARFPALAAIVIEQGGTGEAIRLIAGVLERDARAENLGLDDTVFAAQQFLHMVISWPQRRAMGLGTPMTPAELEAWRRNVVNLFLNGCRGWAQAAP